MAEPLTYEEMLAELLALIGTRVTVQVWATPDDETVPIMIVEGVLATGRAQSDLDFSSADGEAVMFWVEPAVAGFMVPEDLFEGGRDSSRSLSFSIGETVVTVMSTEKP